MKETIRDKGLHGLIASILVGIMVTMGLTSAVAIDRDRYNAFCQAAGRGDIEAVKSQLADYVNVDVNNLAIQLGQHPLLNAAAEGHLAVVELLVTQPTFDPNYSDSLGRNALNLAAKIGHLELVALLLAQPTLHPDRLNRCNENVLQIAAEAGQLRIVERLLADERITRDGLNCVRQNVFHLAAAQGHLEVVQFLRVDPRINPGLLQVRDMRDRTPLDLAVRGGHIEMVRFLLEDLSIGPNQVNQFGQNLFHIAAEAGHLEIFQLLLAHLRTHRDLPHLLNAEDTDGRTLVVQGARSGEGPLVRSLLEWGL